MTEQDPNAYLEAVLRAQTLTDDSDEIKALRARRTEVERLLRDGFPDSVPTLRYAGSKAKCTMIRESFDLDISCNFDRDDTAAGETLKDIYTNAAAVLDSEYFVERKPSALRLRSKTPSQDDFHVDVVPGRFIDGDDGDVFLYRHSADKERQKTNLDVHISHIRDSGVRSAIRLMKLWNLRNAVRLKTFVLELLVIDLLAGRAADSLSEQVLHVLSELRDNAAGLSVQDPANPNGNDLSDVMNDTTKTLLSSVAGNTLSRIETGGWETVFGPLEAPTEDEKREAIRSAPSVVTVRSKPWLPA
jgi:hypothetical protein